MIYIQKNDDIIQTYEVETDKNRLVELIRQLDKYCYVRKYGINVTTGHFYDDSSKKIEGMHNNASLEVNETYKITAFKKNQCWYHGIPYDVYYEAVYKDSVGLVKLINEFLSIKDDNYDVTNIIDRINNYATSDDFLSFDVRVEKENIKVGESLLKNDEHLLDNIKKYADMVVTARLNENYDFNKLYEIYQEVLKCFKCNLIQETRYFKSK